LARIRPANTSRSNDAERSDVIAVRTIDCNIRPVSGSSHSSR